MKLLSLKVLTFVLGTILPFQASQAQVPFKVHI